MKEIEFKPQTEGFEGTITLKLPSYKERMALLKGVGMKVNADGLSGLDDQLEIAEKLLEKFQALIVKVDLKYGDIAFSDIEELSYYKEGQEVIQELQALMTGGLSLGKK